MPASRDARKQGCPQAGMPASRVARKQGLSWGITFFSGQLEPKPLRDVSIPTWAMMSGLIPSSLILQHGAPTYLFTAAEFRVAVYSETGVGRWKMVTRTTRATIHPPKTNP